MRIYTGEGQGPACKQLAQQQVKWTQLCFLLLALAADKTWYLSLTSSPAAVGGVGGLPRQWRPAY